MRSRGRQAVLERRIAKLKAQLLALGDLRPGSLSEQYNICGTPGCQCKADPPRKHGPYYQVSFTWQGRSKSQFVRHEHIAAMRQQLRNYQRLRALVDAWIAAGLELSRLQFIESTSRSTSGRSPDDGERQLPSARRRTRRRVS
jgi:uncharacterized protein DUF6788